jgi:CheY-like chemotaxis protein
MPDSILKEAKILIIDDERANVRFLEIVLQQAGYHNVFSTLDPGQALSLCAELQPDLLLLDLHMPRLGGFEVMQILRADPNFHPVPILVLTADSAVSVRHRALAEGAKDFLIKPLDQVEVLLRIENLLETRFRNETLEATVREAKRFLLSTFDALTSHVAVLDQDGKILAANKAWLKFSSANGGSADACGVGSNYLSICENASSDAEQAWAIARGIRRVIAGEVAEFHIEYACHSPTERRWFMARVTPFLGEGPVRVVIAHENITERKMIEEELLELVNRLETIHQSECAVADQDDTAGKYPFEEEREAQYNHKTLQA